MPGQKHEGSAEGAGARASQVMRTGLGREKACAKRPAVLRLCSLRAFVSVLLVPLLAGPYRWPMWGDARRPVGLPGTAGPTGVASLYV